MLIIRSGWFSLDVFPALSGLLNVVDLAYYKYDAFSAVLYADEHYFELARAI